MKRQESVEFLLNAASGSEPHARVLAHLVLRALVQRLSGTEQLVLGKRMFDLVSVDCLGTLKESDGDINEVSSFIPAYSRVKSASKFSIRALAMPSLGR